MAATAADPGVGPGAGSPADPGARWAERSERLSVALAAANGFMAVAAGAFGAHGVADPATKALLHTGAQYQAAHAVAALACVALGRTLAIRTVAAAWLFGAGALVFGGSLDLLALSGARLFGAITPLGGLLLLAGWMLLAWRALR